MWAHNIVAYDILSQPVREYRHLKLCYKKNSVCVDNHLFFVYFKAVPSIDTSVFMLHIYTEGRGPRVVVSTAAFHVGVPFVKLSIVRSLHDRDVACTASDLHGLNFEFCVWRAVSSHSSLHPREVLPI